MDFKTFAQDKKDCYEAENGLLLWRITDGGSFCPCRFNDENGNIITHILVLEGTLQVRHGGFVYTLSPGDLGDFIDYPEIELLAASAKISAYIMLGKDTYMRSLLRNNPPIPFSYVLKTRMNPVKSLNGDSLHRFNRRMEGIREECCDRNSLFRDKMVKCAIWLFLMEIADWHIKNGGSKDPSDKSGRTERLFVEFMHLLPQHAINEHFTEFYADRLCVTPQYLNRIVKSFSGRTVSRWIIFHLVAEITKRLENTSDPMQQIASDFNFSDQASLTKFFKRETGYSPTEYQKKLHTS